MKGKKWNERVKLRNKKGMRREGNERMKWTVGTKESKIKWEGRKGKKGWNEWEELKNEKGYEKEGKGKRWNEREELKNEKGNEKKNTMISLLSSFQQNFSLLHSFLCRLCIALFDKIIS